MWERIAHLRGGVPAPFRVLLHSPATAGAVARLGEWVRYRSPLPPDLRELAILAAARAVGSRYAWEHHRPLALQAGVRQGAISALETGEGAFLPREGPVVALARAWAEGVDPATLWRVQALLGPEGAVALALCVGYFFLLGSVMRALGVEEEPPGSAPGPARRTPSAPPPEAGAATSPVALPPALERLPEGRAALTHLLAHTWEGLQMPGDLRVLAGLAVARALDCPALWEPLERRAHRERVREGAVSALRQGLAPHGLIRWEAWVVRYALDLARRHTVAEEAFAEALDLLGPGGLVDLTVAAAADALLCRLARALAPLA